MKQSFVFEGPSTNSQQGIYGNWSVGISATRIGGGTGGLTATFTGVGAPPVAEKVKNFRVTIELIEPEIVYRPWISSEVPVGALVRPMGRKEVRWVISGCDDTNILCGKDWLLFSRVADNFECSTDGGKTWRYAGHTEEVVK